MSNPEERLAALLHSAEVPVRGDGLARIQARLGRRRWTRWAVPVAALATAGTAASVIVLSGPADRDTLTVQPADSPSATAEPSVTPNAPAPCPTPLAGEPHCTPYTTTPVLSSYDGPFIWPAPQTSLDVEAWRSDPQKVVERFVTDFLKLDGVTVSPQATSAPPGQGQDELLRANGTAIALVTVEPMQHGTSWVVTQSNGFGGTLTAPGFGETVTSPLDVRGTLDHGVDESVRLSLVTRAGTEIAQTSAPAGSAVPWSGTLTWSDSTWADGAVVGVTRSLKDGSVTRVFAQPVVRATGAEVATFVGIVDGHASTFATDGSVGRQLTYPPTGSTDVEAGFNGTSTLVVRTTPNRYCSGSKLIRIDGTQVSTVDTGAGRVSTPRLSPSGEWEAWVATSCPDGKGYVAVRQGQAPWREFPVPDGQTAAVESIRDDGSVLVRVGTTGSYVERLHSPTISPATEGVELSTATGCTTSAPAFDGPRIVAWETCGGKVHLVRYDGNAARVSADPDVPLSDAPVRTSVNSGRILVWLFGGDTVGEIARYQDGVLTTVLRNTGCTSVSEPKGCVREPSW